MQRAGGQISLVGGDVGFDLAAADVQHLQLQRLAQFQLTHQPVDAAPGGFQRLERRVLQHLSLIHI